MEDRLEIAGVGFSSRLILGTGGAPSMTILEEAIRASGTEMVTVALRRVTPGVAGSVLDVCDRTGVRLLPNTAGCFTAREAVAHGPGRPRGLRDRLGEARGDRRGTHLVP